MFSTGFFADGENAYSFGSSGFYSLFFDNDNILRLLYDGLEVSAITSPIHGWHLGKLIRTQCMLDGVVK